MKKSGFILWVLVLAFQHAAHARQQQDSSVHKIAIFTPLYLDSAFVFDSVYNYRFAKNVFPKYISPGLEFYEGVQIALDSFSAAEIPLEVHIFDTRSSTQTLEQQLNSPQMEGVELILAYCSSPEVRLFAETGLRRNIPVVNVNLPNDAGVKANPFYVILNPTLRTQCEGIYAFIQKYYSRNNLVVFRKRGALEDRIKMYIDDYGKSTLGTPLKLRYVDLPDSFTTYHLTRYLDTTNTTLCIAGSLDENFGKRLALQLAAAKKMKYKSALMGMPTWDGIRDFKNPEYKGVDIIYSTPFYNSRTDKISESIIEYFSTVMYARPSDMVMRGYEVMWRFGNLLIRYQSDIASNITHPEYNVFREFNIQPVLNRETLMLDYFENKKLYFLKWQDGLLKPAF